MTIFHGRALVLIAVAFCALGTTQPLGAQTTFLGKWREETAGWVYGETYRVYDNEPYLNPDFYEVNGPVTEVVVTVGNEPYTQEYWEVRPILVQGTARGTYTDNHWSNPDVWSAGLPDLNTDVRIMSSKTILMPGPTETVATARSLTIFATKQDESGNYVVQDVTLSGNLNLTPLVFNESLRVGVASALLRARTTNLTLSGATITSAGIAKIGVGLPAGAGGGLTGRLTIQDGSQWFHPAGLIELGGGDGVGFLEIFGGVLAGSFLPGAEPGPRVVVNPNSAFWIYGGTARLSELSLNSGNYSSYIRGLWVETLGSLETARLIVGDTASAFALFDTAISRLGEVTVGRDSMLEIVDSITQADSLEIAQGRVQLTSNNDFTIGDPNTSAGSTQLLRLAVDAAATSRLSVAGNEGDTGTLTVHGSALIGGYGEAIVSVGTDATLDIRGSATLGRSESSAGGAAGNGSVYVSGGVFRVQNIEVGFSYFDSYSYNPYPSPTGLLSVSGRVEVTGSITGDGWSMMPDAEGNYAYGPTVEAGYMTIGKNGTLRIQASGKVAFTDPTGGTAVRYYGNQRITNYGLITGGETSASTLESGGQIDFGAAGGSLVNAGRIAPGNSAGWLTVNGDITFIDSLSMGAGGKLLIELGGTTAGLGYDVLDVWGNADLTGATVEFSLINGYAPQLGDTFTFLLVGGDLTGMFATLVDNTGLGLTLDHLSLVAGGVMLTMPASAVPEPSSYAVLAGFVALGCVAFVRQRSK